MRYIIAAATAFTLVVGIAIGFTLTAIVFEAEAKPPPPGPQAVEEQNLDGSGFIAVHEQGTADVNVTNAALPVSGTVDVGNLPAVQDVNVLSQPVPEGRLIELSLAPVPTSPTIARSPLVDISDCGVISIFSTGTVANDTQVSPDGTNLMEVDLGRLGGVSRGGSFVNIPVAIPFIKVTSPASTTQAWIWCAP